MKHVKLLLFFLFLSVCGMFAQNPRLTTAESHAIRAFVNDVKNGRKELVAKAVSYPVDRKYPLEPIRSENEFLIHYDEFIDASVIDLLIDAEWDRYGWRGISCDSNILWGEIDENGEFSVYSFGLNSNGESRWKESVESQRIRLHSSLRDFDSPEIMFKSGRYTIRIDRMPDESYRYASWKDGKSISSRPDIIITGGTLDVQGTMHNKCYSFRNGEYEYQVIYGGFWESGAFALTVSKNSQVLLTQKDGEMIY